MKMRNQFNDEPQRTLPKESPIFNSQNEIENQFSNSIDHNTSTRSKYYIFDNVLGNGSFGEVVEALLLESNLKVAIKRVIQEPKFKNRELDIMKCLSHPNVITLKDYFYTDHPSETGETNRYLNLVMEHMSDSVFRVLKNFSSKNQPMPIILIQLYIYQLCRSLGYLHAMGFCHRDVKPQNLLVDSNSHILKLCDFGSSKKLISGETSVPYICSRFYRAPELILGAHEYTTAVDVWSLGCVFGELLLGHPLFPGDSSFDQFVRIIKVLGTPTKLQLTSLSPAFSAFELPTISKKDWRSVLTKTVPKVAADLLSLFLVYEPDKRLKPLDALAHPFFDELRMESTRLPSGNPLPELFSFNEIELSQMSPETQRMVIPSWYSNTN